MTSSDKTASTVLIAAPLGKDALLAAGVLQQAQVAARGCRGLVQLAEQMDEHTLALIIAEEALVTSELPTLLAKLAAQPPWSDIPVIVLTSSGGSDRMSREVVSIFGPSGNVTLLERPLRSLTLVSAVRVALRARQRQHEVRDLLEQREAVFTGITDGFSAFDREWRYTFVNGKAAEYAGLARDQMIGRHLWEIYPEARESTFFAHARKALETQLPQQFEQYYDRWACWLETRIYPTPDGVVVFRANISDRKEQEALVAESDRKLQENEALLRLAIEAADAGTFDYYPLTGELRLSARCRELLGISADVAVNYDTYVAAVHPEDRHVVRDTAAAALRQTGAARYDIEYRIAAPDEGVQRWVAEKGRAIHDAEGRVTRFLGTILEITEKKNAQIVLEQAKRQAEEANRAKDQFLAMLSHELRTPLTPVLMTIASLRRAPDLSDDLRRDLEVLQRNVELEALLIDDLLDLTRIAHGKLTLHSDAIDIHTSLEHALGISEADIEGKTLTVRRHFAAAEHHCWADAARIQQVFWNLIKNAVKFTSSGGVIEVRTRNDDAHQIVIEISDNGIGIHRELLPRIFDAFEQGGRTMTSEYGGLGLGLAISKRVIDLHGGTITGASEGVGRGATFTVTLAAMQTSLLDTNVVYVPSEPLGTDAHILLVEDHEDTARVLRRILEHGGYRVAHANSIATARQLANGARFDLLISDVGLPDGSGLELMRSLRAEHGFAGIALSGFGTEDDLAASRAAGFAEHLTKPVDWPHLRGAIERVLTGQREALLTARGVS